MVRPPTRVAFLFTALIALGLLSGTPDTLRGADPSTGSIDRTVPPTVDDGPLTLPDRTVLPVAPPEIFTRPSVQAEMAAQHAADPLVFVPGERPTVPLAPPGLSLAPADATESEIVTLGLAQPSLGSGADLAALPNSLRREVLGFLPYWMLDASKLQWMQYQLVSTIAYFGVAAKSDGTLATYATGWSGWYSSAITNVINTAHARGVKVVLTVTMMAWDGGAQMATLLGSSTYRARLVDAIVAAVRDRNADGVNLDFEPVAVAQRDQYTSFVRQLKAALVNAGVGSHLSVCTMAGAATWSTGYDLAGLVSAGAADALFVMGYDYSWSGSARAGGVAPMESPYILDVNESVDDYLRIVPASRIIWGVPYYGRTWRTQSADLNAQTQPGASSTSVAYYYTGNVTLASRHGRLWDAVGRVPWFRYWDSAAASWVQGYYDDAVSLGAKWDMVNQRGLAGTGMWTLLMDAGSPDLWNLIASKFVNDVSPPTGGITTLPRVTDASAIPVSWRAADAGSGTLSYSVQVRDRAGGSWVDWMANTTVTSGHWIGQAGHTYEFRLSAVDRLGNRQPWVPMAADPGSNLAVGGFAAVASDTLNVRAGAGTGFGVQHVLDNGDRVALMSGPIAAGGYDWYQIQYGFTEWPSAEYPRVGWSAAGASGVPYLTPAVAPTVTTLAPTVSGVSVVPRRISPNGDGVLDGSELAFTLSAPAFAARLDVLAADGAVVASRDLGPLAAGPQRVTWDGRIADGSWASAGAYLPRVTITDTSGDHVGPTHGVDVAVLGEWGVTADLVPPTVAASSPTGNLVSPADDVTVTFSEPVTTSAQHLTLVDTSTEAAVASVITFDPMASRAVLNPVDDLDLDRTYRVHVDPLIRDVAGNLIVPTEWSFRTAPPTTYVPLNPARVVDTRNGNGLSGVFSASQPRTFTVAGRGSIPATAIAVSGTLTVTGQTHAGYLSLGPDPISAPTSSTLNFPVGDTRATGVTVALGPGGTLSATYSAPGGATTHLVFDVTGYFVMAGP